jgi:hypothetical protein
MAGLITVLAGHLAELAKLKAYAAALYGAAAGSLLFALVFGLVALHNLLALTHHVAYPDLWIAGGFVVIALILVGFGVWMWRRRPTTYPAASIMLFAAPPAVRLGMRVLTPRVVAVGTILFVGLMVGRRLTARRT